MKQVNLDVAERSLRELVQHVVRGGEIVITGHGNRPLAKLVRFRSPGWKREAGNAEGKVWMAPDFDEPLEDFAGHVS